MPDRAPLAVLLNGSLGVGKSTLAEALGEAIERSVTLDGDQLSALNPPPADEVRALHETIGLLIGHHLARGYDRFVIPHYWSSADELAALGGRLRAIREDFEVRAFLLTLPRDANLRRIAARRSTRAIDETEFEAQTFAGEFDALSAARGLEFGEPFHVSDRPEVLVARMLRLLGLPPPSA